MTALRSYGRPKNPKLPTWREAVSTPPPRLAGVCPAGAFAAIRAASPDGGADTREGPVPSVLTHQDLPGGATAAGPFGSAGRHVSIQEGLANV